MKEKQNDKELGDILALLKRKRRTVRGNVTRFITQLNSDLSATSDTLNENVEYISHRLSDCLLEMKKLDNDIHSLLTDGDYDNDIIQCEEYVDNAELAIFKTKKFGSRINFEYNTSQSPEVTVSQIPVTQVPVMQLPVSQSHTVKLPTIKLDTFRGDIEQWQCFWVQFKSSIDDNNSLSLIDKHVFLRGYLEDEPRRLVDGISVSASTYETTKALLQNRYGDKNRMIQAHLDFLENISPIRNPTPIALNKVFIECNRRLNALTALGEDINAYGRVLAPKILRAFPDDICRRWIIYAKREKISEGDMNKLVQYLSEEVEGALATLKIRGEQNFDYTFKTSTAALHLNSKKVNQTKKPSPFCAFCEINGHWPQDCTIITDIDTRIQKLKTSDTRTPNFTHLQTARVYITGPTGITKLTRCILDCGSQTSFIHSHLVDYLKLDVISSDSLEIHAFESSSNQAQSRRKVRFKLSSIWNQSEIYLHAFESPNRYAVHPSVPLEIASMAHKKKFKLADPNDTIQEMPIEVLIGADFYWTVVNSEIPFRLSETIVLIPSIFGWILSGSRSHTSVASLSSVHNISITSPYILDDQVRKFWDLDTLGIKAMQDKEMSIRNSEILEDFRSSYEVLENRRVVRLPWKKDVTLSSNNYHVASKRFNTLCKKLQTDPSLKEMYVTLMEDYIDKRQVEIAPENHDKEEKSYYIPHHVVIKEKNAEIKGRIVFDASSHTPGHPSLNDVLEQGPNLLPEILATLLRFRLHKQAIISDGSQAFLQLTLWEKDRCATKFLWFKTRKNDDEHLQLENEIVVYQFTRLPFGLTSSPFLLSATLDELCCMYSNIYPTAAKHLKAKWSTNSQVLKNEWKKEKIKFKSKTQVLGVHWDTEEDSFHQNIKEHDHDLFKEPVTKRLLLKIISKIFDPLGIFSPSTVVGKILFQDTWLCGIEWDELLPPSIASRWSKWIIDLPHLNDIRIPRWIGISSADVTIHVFCDASERAYGTVLYVRFTEDTKFHVRMVCSRNRLSPLKRITLPRLELLAALLGARLLHYFCTETKLDRNTATLWSDSTVALNWIQGDPNRWKTFVCNQTKEILNYTNPTQWRYCPGNENPADHLSRGVAPTELKSLDLWCLGPTWLTQSSEFWPSKQLSDANPDIYAELRKPASQSLLITSYQPLIDISRFSSYMKPLRVTAWIFRFLYNCRSKQRISIDLTCNELNTAKNYWILTVQKQCFSAELHALQNNSPLPKSSKISRFNPFLQKNLIRLGGRLQFASLKNEQKHPLLLDGSHPFVHLFIYYTHVKLHYLDVQIVLSDIRSNFWIIRGREAIKRVLYKCLPCKLSQASRSQQIEAPLPRDRITPCLPFTTIGIDFAGPLYVRNL
ncbi:uncharacterized protein [Parasteatoda tepidariorum]|uniref:uncharacterized protein n=1 Tax=Parasteatoda tepidariorum TaxID=114398 RepID=UPI0039BCA45B